MLEDNHNYFYEHRETFENLFNHYQIDFYAQIPTTPDPTGGTIVSIVFYVLIAWIVYRILFWALRPILLKKNIVKEEIKKPEEPLQESNSDN